MGSSTSRPLLPSGDSQRPRLHVSPKYTQTDGDLAGDFASAYGLAPDIWQRFVLDDWLAVSEGRWASLTCGLSVARQNGKNALIEIRELYGSVGLGERILHTAHEVKTHLKHFRRMKHFFGDKANDPGAKYPELNALVEHVRHVNGQEAILLKNGGSIEFVARSKSSGRGFTVDVLVMDEAQEMSEEELEALMPTTSASPLGNPQWIFAGTPPGLLASGEVFTRVRDEATGDSPGRLTWHEWSVDGAVDLDDRELWKLTNPALEAGRLQIEVIEGERARFSDEGFARERLGRWDANKSSLRAFKKSSWSVLVKPKPADGVKCFGVKFTPDGTTVALGAGIRDESGLVHVEGIRQENAGEGLGWLSDFLADRFESTSIIVIDGKAGTGALVQALKDAGVNRRGIVLVPSLDQYAQAHSMLLEAVKSGTVSHRGQAALDDQVFDAVKRPLSKTSGAFGWAASDGGMIPLLDAVTLAFWAAKTTRVNMTASRSDASQRRLSNVRRGR